MRASGRKLNLSSGIAVLCIAVYIAAISFGAVRIVVGIGERRSLAEMEFYDLADRASSAAVSLGFMSDAYQQSIRDYFSVSETLLGVIITGSSGEYAFERFPGAGIVWSGNSPRFRPNFPAEPFYLPLRIEGQRNVNIQAVYSFINYDLFLRVLRGTLLAILSALALAFITLLLELVQKNKSAAARSSDYAKSAPAEDDGPQGLYTPRANIGWESYLYDRLNSELQRCASFEKDLVYMIMELGITDDSLYGRFAEEAVNFFSMRDLIFERGEYGISVIIPSENLDEGMRKAEDFYKKTAAGLLRSYSGAKYFRIGLSSRSGRLIEADRLILEATTALEKTLEPPVSHIVAFKSNADKYREYIRKSS